MSSAYFRTRLAVVFTTSSGLPRAAAATRPGQSAMSKFGPVGEVTTTTTTRSVQMPSEGISGSLLRRSKSSTSALPGNSLRSASRRTWRVISRITSGGGGGGLGRPGRQSPSHGQGHMPKGGGGVRAQEDGLRTHTKIEIQVGKSRRNVIHVGHVLAILVCPNLAKLGEVWPNSAKTGPKWTTKIDQTSAPKWCRHLCMIVPVRSSL